MKKLFNLLLISLIGGGYYLHSQDLLDDTPHYLLTLSKPVHEQPIHHFYYGLKSGEFLFTGMALDSAAKTQLSAFDDLSESKRQNLTDLMGYATCQLELEVLNSSVEGETAIATVRINTVPPSKLLKAFASGALSGLFAESTSASILSSMKEAGCTERSQDYDQKVELHKEDGSWRICSECAGRDMLFELMTKALKASL